MQEFWVKTVCTLLIIGILLGYNATLDRREKKDEIAKLKAEVETLQLASSLQKEKAQEEETGGYNDGVYQGTASGFGGDITLEVTVENHQITDMEIISAPGEDSAFLSMAESIIPDMIEEQSAEVDTVSGATFSSTGIREAAAAALEKAVQ